MKTKRGAIAVLTTLLMVTPFFGTMADTIKPHKVTFTNLVIDSVDTTAKTITVHDSTPTTYTIICTKKTKLRRASGEKFSLSVLLEVYHNDSITVWGTTTDGTNINASKVRNNSTRRIKGKYTATIAAIGPAGDPYYPPGIQGELLAVKNGNQLQDIAVYNYTKYKSGKNKITYANLQAGDVVDIQGISRTLSAPFSITLIYNTTQIKVKSHGAAPTNFLPTSFKFNSVK